MQLTVFILSLKNDEVGLGIVNKANQFILECPNQYLYRSFLQRGEDKLEFRIIVDYHKRDKAELDLVYTQNVDLRTVNILAAALGEPVYITTESKRKFSMHDAPLEVVPVITPTGSIASAVDIKIKHTIEHDAFPYLSDKQLSNLLPWDSWLTLLLRLSLETQRSVYKSMCCDFTAADCIKYVDLMGRPGNPDEAYLYSDLVAPENVEFFKHMAERDDHNFADVEKYIEGRAASAIALGNFYREGN